MKTRTLAGLIFSMAATIPYLFILMDNSHKSEILEIDFILNFLVLPSFCALVVGLYFGRFIRFDPRKRSNGLIKSFAISVLIVVLSLIIWGNLFGIFEFKVAGLFGGFKLALGVGYFLSWLVYPSGLLAGYFVWCISESRYPESN